MAMMVLYWTVGGSEARGGLPSPFLVIWSARSFSGLTLAATSKVTGCGAALAICVAFQALASAVILAVAASSCSWSS